jgi:metal-responsive CopG/Arc/MetJ family transcriptional regulator
MLYSENKVQVAVWLQPEVVANCDTYAEYFSQSRSGFINEALKLYIKHAEKHCQLLAKNRENETNSHGHNEESLAA